MKTVVIVIVYNGAKYLQELIESLSNMRSREVGIIFVDNASSDNSVEIIARAELPNKQLIKSEQNLGFAGGNNVGIKKALAAGVEYIVLLNQDTVVQPDWLEQLTHVAESRPEVGAVQALLLYWDRQDIVNSWGNYIHFLGFEFAGGNLEKAVHHGSQITNPKEITYAAGTAVLYKASALKEIGLLDEILESYHEDADIGLRLRLHGYQNFLAPQSVVYHKYEFLSASRIGHHKYFLMERNRLYTLLKYYSAKTLILIFPTWLVMELGLIAFAFMRGFWREKFQGYAWLFRNWGLVMKKRREIKALRQAQGDRKVGDRELTRDFVGRISYQEIDNPLLTWVGNPVMSLYWSIIKRII